MIMFIFYQRRLVGMEGGSVCCLVSAAAAAGARKQTQHVSCSDKYINLPYASKLITKHVSLYLK